MLTACLSLGNHIKQYQDEEQQLYCINYYSSHVDELST
jgi:hypothetical protein